MASPLRIPDEADAAQLEDQAKQLVLKLVREASGPMTPVELFAAVRGAMGAPFSLAQLAMWDLVARGDIKFTSDYRLVANG